MGVSEGKTCLELAAKSVVYKATSSAESTSQVMLVLARAFSVQFSLGIISELTLFELTPGVRDRFIRICFYLRRKDVF